MVRMNPLDNPAAKSDTPPMAAAQLSLAPRTKGRATVPLVVELVGELTPADLTLMASEREVPTATPLIQKLRDRHHHLASCLAQGMTDAEASAITGYDISRISILKNDPSFKALLADKRCIENATLAEFTARASVLALTAMNNLQEKLEDDANPLPASMELEIAKSFADRTGHAPVQKSLNINANVDLGSRLSEARKRLQAVVSKAESGDSDFGSTPSG